ncbi:MAG: prolipoprotein diacylglyceryl transferase [Polyangiaceae bacterium]|nr:prolipoprotein diacylglyceryl transferase [Polyangiaceae bacterium]
MSAPLIPYIDLPVQIPEKPLEFLGLSLSIKIFGILVAIGVYVGVMVSIRRARQRFIDPKRMTDFIFWVVATGFVLSHVLDAIFYHPDTVAKNPLYLLKIWDGLSSYGGLIGAVIGAFLWSKVRRRPILEPVDVCVSAFPLAWVFGRLGCSTVHDHPGALTTSWIGVKYPVDHGGAIIDGVYHGRYDLGLYEMVLTIPLALACWWLWRRRPFRAPGFYVGLTTAYYAPIRFGLDFLRVGPEEMGGAGDPRYLGLTPAQWACFVALALGIYMLKRSTSPAAVAAAAASATARAEEARLAEEDEKRAAAAPAQATKAPRAVKVADEEPADGAADEGTARDRARARRQQAGKRAKKKAAGADAKRAPSDEPAEASGEPEPPAEPDASKAEAPQKRGDESAEAAKREASDEADGTPDSSPGRGAG